MVGLFDGRWCLRAKLNWFLVGAVAISGQVGPSDRPSKKRVTAGVILAFEEGPAPTTSRWSASDRTHRGRGARCSVELDNQRRSNHVSTKASDVGHALNNWDSNFRCPYRSPAFSESRVRPDPATNQRVRGWTIWVPHDLGVCCPERERLGTGHPAFAETFRSLPDLGSASVCWVFLV